MSARLQNGDRAVLDIRKIEDYCLDPLHPVGRNKARVFRDALGIERSEAGALREEFLEAVRTVAGVPAGADKWGPRWSVDVPISRQDRRAVVRTIWMVRVDEDVPRFVTCWVL
ncbi:MAG: DUF6883 domain-containing protein [Roseiarcus sp.]